MIFVVDFMELFYFGIKALFVCAFLLIVCYAFAVKK